MNVVSSINNDTWLKFQHRFSAIHFDDKKIPSNMLISKHFYCFDNKVSKINQKQNLEKQNM
jgi:hypothetical protein